MKYSLLLRTDALVICVLLFLAMIVMVRMGMLVSTVRKDSDLSIKEGIGSLRGAVFGLFAFILAFCFSMSASRYDTVRKSLIDESNNIAAAINRSDLYPDSLRSEYRADFRHYLEARIDLYADLGDAARMKNAQQSMENAVQNLWLRTTNTFKQPNTANPTAYMISALTDMNDASKTREVMLRTSVPDGIIYTVLLLAIFSSFIAGVTSNGLKYREWVIIICFALFTSLVVYMTLDLGRPLRGIIKADTSQEAVIELHKMLEH